MKLEAWVAGACLASLAAALGPSIPGKTGPKRPDGKPAKMDDWKWADPFSPDSSSTGMRRLEAACEAEKTFKATEYLLDDLSEAPPLGLLPFHDALKKVFANRQYPGSWDGIDPHGYDRNLLMMEYADVPVAVREWIEDQERSSGDDAAAAPSGKGLFAVYEKPATADDVVRNTVRVPDTPVLPGMRPLDKKKVVIFAPGAVYETLPLWVAEGSDCADILLDLSKYSAKPVDGGVVAYPTSKTKARRASDRRDMEFTIKAQVLKAKAQEDAGAIDEEAKDEL